VTSTELRPYKKIRDSEAVRPMMSDDVIRQGGLGGSGSSLLDGDGDGDGNVDVVDIAGMVG
jgi:hypothetical protein